MIEGKLESSQEKLTKLVQIHGSEVCPISAVPAIASQMNRSCVSSFWKVASWSVGLKKLLFAIRADKEHH